LPLERITFDPKLQRRIIADNATFVEEYVLRLVEALGTGDTFADPLKVVEVHPVAPRKGEPQYLLIDGGIAPKRSDGARSSA
jgi:hypothetical protein